jgi:hypothetical protein
VALESLGHLQRGLVRGVRPGLEVDVVLHEHLGGEGRVVDGGCTSKSDRGFIDEDETLARTIAE